MELKLERIAVTRFLIVLLIVPYGIETCYHTGNPLCVIELLIVPYGIETLIVHSHIVFIRHF